MAQNKLTRATMMKMDLTLFLAEKEINKFDWDHFFPELNLQGDDGSEIYTGITSFVSTGLWKMTFWSHHGHDFWPNESIQEITEMHRVMLNDKKIMSSLDRRNESAIVWIKNICHSFSWPEGNRSSYDSDEMHFLCGYPELANHLITVCNMYNFGRLSEEDYISSIDTERTGINEALTMHNMSNDKFIELRQHIATVMHNAQHITAELS